MKVEYTVDMVIPFWGIFTAMVIGGFYIVKMKFELDHLSKELKEIKELMHEIILKRSHEE